MKFINELIKVDPEAGFMEKAVTYFVPVFILFWLVLAFGSAWGWFHNGLSLAAQDTPGWSKMIGWVLLIGAGVFAWFNFTDRIKWRINNTAGGILVVVLLGFSLAFFCGFWISIR